MLSPRWRSWTPAGSEPRQRAPSATLQPDAGPGSAAIPFQTRPYNDTDWVMGHGPHVAGIVAADGSSNPALTGMAPGAHLVGLSTGEVLLIITALAAFDQILDHP